MVSELCVQGSKEVKTSSVEGGGHQPGYSVGVGVGREGFALI